MLDNIKNLYGVVSRSVEKVIVGKKDVVDLAVISLLCGGHMLIDDVPGTGKTVFAKAFAKSLSLVFKRIQCVPDLLPSDLTGVVFFDMKKSEFRFIEGPVFTNILLVDEINRAMPKTQSGLLECMEEHQVTVEGKSYPLEDPFMVIATQNPIETKGTFDLPEAQLDRFLVKTHMGYPSHEESVEILNRKLYKINSDEINDVSIDRETLSAAKQELDAIFVHRDIMSYAADVCEATRRGKNVMLGASPRAMISLIRVACGYAALSGRDYVIPDDIKQAAVPVLSHRIVFNNNFFHKSDLGEEFIRDILNIVSVPSEDIIFSHK